MEILVCVKRVPTVGGKIAVTPDGQEVDTRMSGFSISPHEECAVEEAVQITERLGGAVSVLTLGHRSRGRAAPGGPGPGRQPRRPAGDRRPGIRPDRRPRPPSPPRSGSHTPATWSCWATRRPTPATTRSASGSRTSSAGRWPPGSRSCRCRRTAWSPGANTAAYRRRTRFRCPPWSPSRRASTCPGTHRCAGGCGPRAPPSSGPAGLGAGRAAQGRRSGCRTPAGIRPPCWATGTDAVPELVRVLDELGVLS